MPRTAVLKLVGLRNGLVNLPLSIYGPLVEHGTTPQTLAIELSLVRKAPSAGKKERKLLVGWTGLASQVSAWRGSSVKEALEMDPQVAAEMGWKDGDEVGLELHRSLPLAKVVNVEPASADDWEILESNAEYVESNLLSQVRAVSEGQIISVWVLGKTRVRFRVESFEPVASAGVILSTDTEVIVAPKSRSAAAADAKAKHDVLDPSNKTAETRRPEADQEVKHTFLRILPVDVNIPTLRDLGEGTSKRPDGTASPSAPPPEDSEVSIYLNPHQFRRFSSAFPTSLCSMHLLPRPNALQRPAGSATKEADAKGKEKGKGRAATAREVLAVKGVKARLEMGVGVPYGCVWLSEDGRRAAKISGLDYELVRFAPLRANSESNGVPPPEDTLEAEVQDTSDSASVLAGVDDKLKQAGEYLWNSLACAQLRGGPRAGGVPGLLICGSSGSGKTSVAKAVAKAASLDSKTLLSYRYVDCSKHVDDRLPTMKANLKDWFDGACWHAPSLLLLDNLDRMLPAEVEHIDSFRFRHLAEDFVATAASACADHPVIILATVGSTSSLHPLLSTCHLFAEQIALKPPDKNGRKAIVTSLAGAKAASSDLTVSQLNATAVATLTEGYLPTDLRDLVDRAVHQAAIRASASDGPVNLTTPDFDAAQKDFVPLSLRDVKLQKSEVQWADIGGLNETRRVLRETLEWPTKYGAIFASCPLRLRSGLLLYGYPGCGKTLLASAIAKECGLNFISVKGPELLNKYIGASEKSVRDLFERAQAAKPCVLFFDEFDSIAPKRGHDSTGVTDRVVNQLLTQMDGAEGLDGVYVLAATSRPDLIDPALLRPGRLDKSLLCGMPDENERIEIMTAVSRTLPLDPGVNFDDFATDTEGFTGADLQAFVYAAHLEIVHESMDAHNPKEEAHPGQANGTSLVEEESKVDWLEVTGASDRSAEGKIVRSRAEEEAVRKRLEVIMATLAGGDARKRRPEGQRNGEKEEKARISTRHLRSALKTIRPSVPTDELIRLRRIYAKFVDARSPDGLPDGEASVEIGGRASLM